MLISNRIGITNGRITLPYGFWMIIFTKRICIYYLLHMYRDCHCAYKLNLLGQSFEAANGRRDLCFQDCF